MDVLYFVFAGAKHVTYFIRLTPLKEVPRSMRLPPLGQPLAVNVVPTTFAHCPSNIKTSQTIDLFKGISQML